MIICPICKSANLDLYMGGQFGKYQCKNCGYIGPFVIEKYKRKKKTKKMTKSKEKKAAIKL